MCVHIHMGSHTHGCHRAHVKKSASSSTRVLGVEQVSMASTFDSQAISLTHIILKSQNSGVKAFPWPGTEMGWANFVWSGKLGARGVALMATYTKNTMDLWTTWNPGYKWVTCRSQFTVKLLPHLKLFHSLGTWGTYLLARGASVPVLLAFSHVCLDVT